VQLFGNAVVVREGNDAQGKPLPKLEFRGEFLHAFVNSERVKSQQAGDADARQRPLHADSMDYDNLDRVMELRGRVRGVLQPARRGAQA
jgi:lipopolysaccharide export system protein LptC